MRGVKHIVTAQEEATYRAGWESATSVPFGHCWCGCGEQTKPAAHTDAEWGIIKGLPQRYVHNHHRRFLPHDIFTPAWLEPEAQAWAMGLWTADGCYASNYTFSLELTDFDAVEKAAGAFGIPGDRVRLKRPHKVGHLPKKIICVGARYLAPRLAALGIYPGRKTGREIAPPTLALSPHFWRGMIEGDGWITDKVVGLVTTSDVLVTQFVTFVHHVDPDIVVGVHTRPRGESTSMGPRGVDLYQMGVSGGKGELLHALYDSATVSMTRKHQKALAVLDDVDERNSLQKRRENRRADIVRLYASGQSTHQIAREYGFSLTEVQYAVRISGLSRDRLESTKLHYDTRTHCTSGRHEWVPANWYEYEEKGQMKRRCRPCANERGRIYMRRKRTEL